MSTVLILDNIRSAHNVGSIFRTADGAGVEQIFLVGTTPDPIDRFGRVQPEIAKTSLGATTSVVWEHSGGHSDRATEAVLDLLTRLQARGYTVVAVEQTATSIPLYEHTPTAQVAYILGAEVEGIQPALVAAADEVVEIPMVGQKESLNVSVTAGIVLFQSQRC